MEVFKSTQQRRNISRIKVSNLDECVKFQRNVRSYNYQKSQKIGQMKQTNQLNLQILPTIQRKMSKHSRKWKNIQYR